MAANIKNGLSAHMEAVSIHVPWYPLPIQKTGRRRIIAIPLLASITLRHALGKIEKIFFPRSVLVRKFKNLFIFFIVAQPPHIGKL
ncbi:MAG: hypothetical protein HGB03_03055 [Candidatus Yonathbacteria bacterium]|nr:hypothetical protein [Candidatus Yonathbacteria bacterium]NTW47388.1 hypothetical protein [Candidatus Yonathbacteria bacterium]